MVSAYRTGQKHTCELWEGFKTHTLAGGVERSDENGVGETWLEAWDTELVLNIELLKRLFSEKKETLFFNRNQKLLRLQKSNWWICTILLCKNVVIKRNVNDISSIHWLHSQP